MQSTRSLQDATTQKVVELLEQILKSSQTNKAPLNSAEIASVLTWYRMLFPYSWVSRQNLAPGAIGVVTRFVPTDYYWLIAFWPIFSVQTVSRAAVSVFADGWGPIYADPAVENEYLGRGELAVGGGGVVTNNVTYVWQNLDLVNTNRVCAITPGALISKVVFNMLDATFYRPLIDYMRGEAMTKILPFGQRVDITERP